MRTNRYLVFKEKESDIINKLENTFLSFLDNERFSEYKIPALIDCETLKRCNYFNSFPQQINIVGNINPDYYSQVMEESNVKPIYLNEEIRYLTPAACLHIYPLFENNSSIENEIITTHARVYRNEKNYNGKTRLQDFSVREFVFIGQKEFVLKHLENMQHKSLAFAQQINNKVELKPSTDNFYPSKKNKVKARMQKANNQKVELILNDDNENVSLSSFNYHHTHFSQAFNFDQKSSIVTGCVGFGLERWLAACKKVKFNFEEKTI
jgi:seryl-tRNA synthetase